MKKICKSALLLALAGGAALFTGCRSDEAVDLAGYPETPAGISIAATGNTTATYEGSYDAEGALQLSGSLSSTYTVTLAQPSPKDVYLRVEPIIVNLPADKVTVSATQLTIPAGHVAPLEPIEVSFDDTDMTFMAEERGAMNYELGLRIVELEGFQTPATATEAKVVVEKTPYVATAVVLLEEGGSEMTFKRSYVDGAIINEEPIECSVKIVLDRPVLKDTRFQLKTAGIPEAFAADATFTPAELMIAAGTKESDLVTLWTVTDDFLLTTEEPETHRLQLLAEPVDADATTVGSQDGLVVTVMKVFDLLTFLPELDPAWVKYDTTGWDGETNGSGSIPDLFDGSRYSDVYTYEQELWFTIDMLVPREIHGIQMIPYGSSVNYFGEGFVLSTSDDGITWAQQGELSTDDMRVSPYYIGLLKPVTARYIKYEGWKGKRGYPDISEFYVYGKN